MNLGLHLTGGRKCGKRVISFYSRCPLQTEFMLTTETTQFSNTACNSLENRQLFQKVGKSKGKQAQIYLRMFRTLPQPQLFCLENATQTEFPCSLLGVRCVKWSAQGLACDMGSANLRHACYYC